MMHHSRIPAAFCKKRLGPDLKYRIRGMLPTSTDRHSGLLRRLRDSGVPTQTDDDAAAAERTTFCLYQSSMNASQCLLYE
jgi:hypothetical protein